MAGLTAGSAAAYAATGIPYGFIGTAVGLVLFFLQTKTDRMTTQEAGLSFHGFTEQLTDTTAWILLLTSCGLAALSIGAARIAVPGYITSALLLLQDVPMPLVVLSIILISTGEEIAWRGYFQKKLGHLAPLFFALLVTGFFSVLAGPWAGDPRSIGFALAIAWLQNLLYGLAYFWTDSLPMTALHHILTNLTAYAVLLSIT